MSSISPDQMKWVVVERLGNMLRRTAEDENDVTHAFALFSSVCAWVRERIGSHTSFEDIAEGLRQPLKKDITDPFWGLEPDEAYGQTRVTPFAKPDGAKKAKEEKFELPNCPAWYFFVWVRNAMSHGDDRTIDPVAAWIGTRELLKAYHFRCSGGHAELTGDRMRSLGTKLVVQFKLLSPATLPNSEGNVRVGRFEMFESIH